MTKTGNAPKKGGVHLDNQEFSRLKDRFQSADLEEKVQIYVNTQGMSTEQYKELLRLYPVDEIGRLEKALK